MNAVARILDANANRARESLRMMEDAARFALDDAVLSEQIKTLRHQLATLLTHLPDGWLEANRDTPGDVGTSISTVQEKDRQCLMDIVIAAGKRLSEALRVIEETSKMIDSDLAAGIKSLRYRAYTIESELQFAFGAGQSVQWKLCLLLTKSMCMLPWREVLHKSITGGVDCVQVREKEVDAGPLLAHVKEVIEIARPAGVCVIVNDRVDVAMTSGADGVHVGSTDFSVRDIRQLAGRTLLVGKSTQSFEEAKKAVQEGADYCGVGTMFSSTTKTKLTPTGTNYLRAFVDRFPTKPHLAIGGITTANAADVIRAGARGIAVSSAICGDNNPERVAHEFRQIFDSNESGASAPQIETRASLSRVN